MVSNKVDRQSCVYSIIPSYKTGTEPTHPPRNGVTGGPLKEQEEVYPSVDGVIFG
jgi:hypothetical protein